LNNINIIIINEKMIKNVKPTTIKTTNDKYTPEILRMRYYGFKENYNTLLKIKKDTGISIRCNNPYEDMTENIVKFIIQNYENDETCRWAKSFGESGDLLSDKYPVNSPIETKSFTSNGPSSFGPSKKFSVIYFLDIRNFMKDIIILWKVNVSNESPEWKQIKMNKNETFEEQCIQKRRPHISWDKIYTQIGHLCEKIYEGSFENIFTQKIKEVE